MTATVAGIHLGIDTHANRPAANTVPDGSIYSCSTHSLIYKSNFAGNSWATFATLGAAASGSITASGYTQSTARLLGRTTASAGAIEEITVGSGLTLSAGSLTATGGGPTYGQSLAYPTSFSGDDDNFASWSNWADVSAFDTAEILNSTIGHLITLGASKDQKKRFTLGTTKAAAFDFRWSGVLPDIMYWSTVGDVYLDLALKTSADAHIAGWRFLPQASFGAIQGGMGDCYVEPVVAGTPITAVTIPRIPRGLAVNLRIVRDGSNNLRFYIGLGQAPVALGNIIDSSNNVPYGNSSSGTVARSEILIHTPSGPGSTAANGMFIDTFQSV